MDEEDFENIDGPVAQAIVVLAGAVLTMLVLIIVLLTI